MLVLILYIAFVQLHLQLSAFLEKCCEKRWLEQFLEGGEIFSTDLVV